MDPSLKFGEELDQFIQYCEGVSKELEKFEGKFLDMIKQGVLSKQKKDSPGTQTNIPRIAKKEFELLASLYASQLDVVTNLISVASAYHEQFTLVKLRLNSTIVNSGLIRLIGPQRGIRLLDIGSGTAEPAPNSPPKAEVNSYELKRNVVSYLNCAIRESSAALAHPENHEPCILFALPTKDGVGRYTLENRNTKKRSGYYKSIIELLPIRLVPDVRRKEGFLEVRKIEPENPAENQD